jgi:hypothetical protein
MKQQYLKEIPEYEVGVYSKKVPLDKALFVAEKTLTANDVLTPRENPSIGAKTIYRIISNGVFAPVLQGFTKKDSSLDFDVTALSVNIIEFTFDGESYWYEITNGKSTIPSAVADYAFWGLGLTPAVPDILCATHPVTVGLITDGMAGGYSAVTAKDIIASVQYTGSLPIIYTMEKFPEGTIPPISGTDPGFVGVAFDETEVGNQTVLIKVGDGVMSIPNYMAVIVTVQDIR